MIIGFRKMTGINAGLFGIDFFIKKSTLYITVNSRKIAGGRNE